jgi:hypothetical protein
MIVVELSRLRDGRKGEGKVKLKLSRYDGPATRKERRRAELQKRLRNGGYGVFNEVGLPGRDGAL